MNLSDCTIGNRTNANERKRITAAEQLQPGFPRKFRRDIYAQKSHSQQRSRSNPGGYSTQNRQDAKTHTILRSEFRTSPAFGLDIRNGHARITEEGRPGTPIAEVSLKEWEMTEAEKQKVDRKTVARWRKDGRYSHLRFRVVNQRVTMVSGDFSIKPVRPVQNTHKYDFSNVDWSQNNITIARQLGCHHKLVQLRRP